MNVITNDMILIIVSNNISMQWKMKGLMWSLSKMKAVRIYIK